MRARPAAKRSVSPSPPLKQERGAERKSPLKRKPAAAPPAPAHAATSVAAAPPASFQQLVVAKNVETALSTLKSTVVQLCVRTLTVILMRLVMLFCFSLVPGPLATELVEAYLLVCFISALKHVILVYRGYADDRTGLLLSSLAGALAFECAKEFVAVSLTRELARRALGNAAFVTLLALVFSVVTSVGFQILERLLAGREWWALLRVKLGL